MTTRAIRNTETSLQRICEAIAQLQQGRSNAHGKVTLPVSPATSVVVSAPTCSDASDVNITPLTLNAGSVWPIWVVPGNGSFTIYWSPATANSDCTFSWSVNG